MNEEIKDILEHLSATQKINNGWTSFSDKECKLLYDYITNLQQKENIINELEKWLDTIPNYFMDKRSNNTGVYVQKGMQQMIDMCKNKIQELKGSESNETNK